MSQKNLALSRLPSWLIKNSVTLEVLNIILAVSAVATTFGVASGNLQKLQIMEKPTGQRLPDHHRIIIQDSDARQLDLKLYKEIARIDSTQRLAKFFYAGLGLTAGLSCLTITMLLERESAVIAYHEEKSTELSKIEIDKAIAAANKAMDIRQDLVLSSLNREFMQNEHYQRLTKERIQAIEQVEDYQSDSDDEYDDFSPIVDSTPVTPPKTQTDYFTHEQAYEVYRMVRAKVNIVGAVEKVTGYTATNANWSQIKEEILTKIKEFIEDEKC